MKIVYVLCGTNLNGGATKSFLCLLDGMIDRGNDCLVITPNRNGVYEYLESCHIPVLSINYRNCLIPDYRTLRQKLLFVPVFIKKLIYNYRASRTLLKICKSFKPDIIHTNTTINDIGYRCASKLNIPHIWHIREYGDLDFGFKDPFKKNRLTSRNNYTISITKDVFKYLKLERNDSNTIVYNGIKNRIENEYIDMRGIAERTYFLYAGRLEIGKGILDLIDAYIKYASIHKYPLPLYIAGNGYLENEIKTIVINHGLERKIFLLGNVDDIQSYYNGAKAVIIPSHFEGFGRVMAEAMFNKCLVIGKNTGGTKEQFDNGLSFTGKEIGLRYKTDDELVSLMCSVTENSLEYFKDYLMRAITTVNNLYTKEQYVENVTTFYKRILHDKSTI